jgi:hypothetical protein
MKPVMLMVMNGDDEFLKAYLMMMGQRRVILGYIKTLL